MEDKKVSFIFHEMKMFEKEREIRRLWIMAIGLFCAFVGTNAYWIFRFL